VALSCRIFDFSYSLGFNRILFFCCVVVFTWSFVDADHEVDYFMRKKKITFNIKEI